MLESTGPNIGTFRIRSTGFSGPPREPKAVDRRHLQAGDVPRLRLLHPARDLGPGHLRLREPLGRPNRGLLAVHEVPPRRPRELADPRHQRQFCDQIVFVGGDHIDGPAAHERRPGICGTPDLRALRRGRDRGERAARGWAHGERLRCAASATRTSSGPSPPTRPVLTPPTTNGRSATIAGPSYTYTGQTKIVLSGNNMTITTNTGQAIGPVAVPSDGVVYVAERRRLLHRLLAVHGHLSDAPRAAETRSCTAAATTRAS